MGGVTDGDAKSDPSPTIGFLPAPAPPLEEPWRRCGARFPGSRPPRRAFRRFLRAARLGRWTPKLK